MTGIIGKKLGMTQVNAEGGKLVPVTVIEAGPCTVVQVKTPEKDGYAAVQVGFAEATKTKNMTKPVLGVFKKAGTASFTVLKEFKMEGFVVGEKVLADRFAKGDVVKVAGVTKGKGFQGTMKRHNFKGGPASHGGMCNRAPGSIGASSYPSRVWRGQRMAGHMGQDRVTLKSVMVVDVMPEQNIILVRGAVPGGKNTIIEIWKD
ncbi:MAG TPA: 50S ribosomal protein L3 [Dissulfurispiraceae bacterium]|nr:50S ribosomal protein L3 [Dissulfurispiraceae bacterium]